MVKNIIFKLQLVCITLALFTNVKAQQKSANYADSVLDTFKRAVFNEINSPDFRSKSYVSTLTVLKIDIDLNGKVAAINFSDGADTLFVKAYLQMSKKHNNRSILEKYVKAKSYSNISILMLVDYDPFHSINRSYYYGNMESLMKFNKENFTGKAVMLSPLKIR